MARNRARGPVGSAGLHPAPIIAGQTIYSARGSRRGETVYRSRASKYGVDQQRRIVIARGHGLALRRNWGSLASRRQRAGNWAEFDQRKSWPACVPSKLL